MQLEKLNNMLNESLHYDSDYYVRMNELDEIINADGMFSSQQTRDYVSSIQSELDEKRNEKIKESIEKLSYQERENMYIYLKSQMLEINANIHSFNEKLNDIQQIFVERYSVKNRVKNLIHPMDYDKLEKQKLYLRSNLHSFVSTRNKLTELIRHYYSECVLLEI